MIDTMDKSPWFIVLFFWFLLSFVHNSPINKNTHKKASIHKNHRQVYQEAEYDISLQKSPEQIRYYVKPEEYDEYEDRFEKIKDLGEEIECKLKGDCSNDRREVIVKKKERDVVGSKKSFGLQDSDASMGSQGITSQGSLNSPVMPPLTPDQFNSAPDRFGGDPRYSEQGNAAQFGQQPQMDIKTPQNDDAAGMMPKGGPGLGEMGPGGGPGGPMGMSGPGGPIGMSAATSPMYQMQMQQNDQIIQQAAQNKLGFMDQESKKQPGMDVVPPPNDDPMRFAGGAAGGGARDTERGDDMSGPHGIASNEGGSVSDNDIMKAEGIQANEMNDLHNFLKSSNQVRNNYDSDKGEAEMTDGKYLPNNDDNQEDSNYNPTENFGKTNIDYGPHAEVENSEGNFGSNNNEPNRDKASLRPGGPEVPVLNNLLGGMGGEGTDNGGDGSSPLNSQFIEQNTKDMMQSNSDYKLPSSAFTNLWKDYMSSTQSQLGGADPSANSRHLIDHPWKPRSHHSGRDSKDAEVKRWKKSDVGQKKKSSLKQTDTTDVGTSKDVIPKPTKHKVDFMYVPLYVVKNLLQEASKKSSHATPEDDKNVKADSKSKLDTGKPGSKSNQPAIYITEKNGKRFLVVNPNSKNELIKGFANVDSHYVSFAIPENRYNNRPMAHINGLPAVGLSKDNGNTHPGPFGKSAVFDYRFQGGDNTLMNENSNGVFQGYMAVPIVNRVNGNGFSGYTNGYVNNGLNRFFNGGDNDEFNNGGFNGGYDGGYNHGYMGGYNDGYNGGFMGGYNGRFNAGIGGYNNGYGPSYYPQRNTLPLGYPNQEMFNPFSQPKQQRFGGNAFMYGPQFNANPYAHRSMFESISMTQAALPANFYQDPTYNPTESENLFQNVGPHTTRDGFERPSDLNEAETNEVNNEINFSEQQHGSPDQAPDEPEQNVFPQNENENERTLQNEPQEASQQAPQEGNGAGYSPSPVEIQDADKRSLSPFVFTKDHVGFGPITVEAKTANAPLDDNTDDN